MVCICDLVNPPKQVPPPIPPDLMEPEQDKVRFVTGARAITDPFIFVSVFFFVLFVFSG